MPVVWGENITSVEPCPSGLCNREWGDDGQRDRRGKEGKEGQKGIEKGGVCLAGGASIYLQCAQTAVLAIPATQLSSN